MTKSQKSKCRSIIYSAAGAVAICGYFRMPGYEIIQSTSVQVEMIMGLAKVFKIPITKEEANQIAQQFVGDRGKRKLIARLRSMPVYDPPRSDAPSRVNLVAATLTEEFGWETAEEFASKAQYKQLETKEGETNAK